jgi:hypothetical protein
MQAASPAAFAVSKAMEQPQMGKFATRLAEGSEDTTTSSLNSVL